MFARQVISFFLSLSLVLAAPIGITPTLNFVPLTANAADPAAAPTKKQIADAEATIKKACIDPKQVSYERSKNKGRTVYKPFLKTAKGKRYCSALGIKDLKSVPLSLNAQTEATDTADCKDCKPKTVKDQVAKLAAQTELAPTCKPDKQTAEQCTKDVLCLMTRDVLRVAMPGAGEVAQRVALPKCGTTRGDASCAAKVGAGIGHGIKDLVKGLYALAKGAVVGTVKGGIAVVKGGVALAKANVKDLFGTLGNFFSNKKVFRTDNTMSLILLTFQKMSKSRFAEAVRHPITFIKNFVKQIYFDALKTSKMMANCQDWKGLPLVSQCKTPVPAWACLNCADKMETVCGMLGFALTDIVAMFTAGVGLAKVAGRTGKALTVVAKAAKRTSLKYLGKAPTKTIVAGTKAVGAAASVVGTKTLNALALLNKVPGYKFADDWLMGGKALQAGLEVGAAPMGRRAAQIMAGGRRAEDLKAAEELENADELADASNTAGLDTSFDVNTPPNNTIQSTKDYLKEVEASKPTIATQTRAQYVSEYKTRQTISDADNMSYANNVNKPKKKGTRVFVFRNSYMKNYNNVDFDRSTAITTGYIERVNTKLEELAKKYEGEIEFKPYEASNRIEVEVIPKSKKLPDGFEEEMANIYKRATAEHHLFLKQNKIVRDIDEPVNIFTYGSGPDAHAANLSVRANKNYEGSLATNTWESKAVQAELETIFMRAKDLHKTIKEDYGKTPLFDQVSGRIDSRVADMISKSETPEELIEKLSNSQRSAHILKDADGKPLPKKDQIARANTLMEYIEYTKSFGVEFYGTRTLLTLKDEGITASSNADISGQNGRNLSHNTTIFDSNFKEVKTSSIKAEQAATDEFNKIIATVVENRTKAMKEAGVTQELVRSGDDIDTVFKRQDGRIVKELSPEAKRLLGNCNDGVVCMRDSLYPNEIQVLVNGRWRPLTNKKDITTVVHKLEKDTRALLKDPDGVFEQRNFWIEVSPDGQMRFRMSYPPNATKAEKLKLKTYEELAQSKFAELVRSKKPEEILHLRLFEGSYLKHSIKTVDLPTPKTIFNKPGSKIFDVGEERRWGDYLLDISKLPQKMQPMAKGAFKNLRDPNLWSPYVSKLQADTHAKMLASKDPEVVAMAKRGELRRNEMLAVIVERAKQRGDGKFKTLKPQKGAMAASDFVSEVKDPFFDKAIINDRFFEHGADIHLIQRDFLGNYLTTEIKKIDSTATQTKFYEELSKNEEAWNGLFDSVGSIATPENMRFILQDYLPLR